jgi:hypothetical protein
MIWSILALTAALALAVFLTYNPRKPLTTKMTPGKSKATGPAEIKPQTWQKKGEGPSR